jgi:hypothetical protein
MDLEDERVSDDHTCVGPESPDSVVSLDLIRTLLGRREAERSEDADPRLSEGSTSAKQDCPDAA